MSEISLGKTTEEGVVERHKAVPIFVLNCRLPFRKKFPTVRIILISQSYLSCAGTSSIFKNLVILFI